MRVITFSLLILALFACKSSTIDNRVHKDLKDISEFINSENIAYKTASSEIIDSINNRQNSDEYLIKYSRYYIIDYTTSTTVLKNYEYNPNSSLFLIEDTVFQENKDGSIKKFTGKIRVLGRLNYTNEQLKDEVNENATLALFNVNNGIFEGNQLFYTSNGTGQGGYYLFCEIKPFMDIVYNRDFKEVSTSEESDLSSGSDFTGYKYYKVLNSNTHTFKVSRFWINGKLFYTCNYTFSPLSFIMATLNNLHYSKLFEPKSSSTISIYHYNGNLAYEGTTNAENSLIPGKLFTFNKIETDLKHFKLQTSFSSEREFDHIYPIANNEFKQYRRYFGITPSVD